MWLHLRAHVGKINTKKTPPRVMKRRRHDNWESTLYVNFWYVENIKCFYFCVRQQRVIFIPYFVVLIVIFRFFICFQLHKSIRILMINFQHISRPTRFRHEQLNCKRTFSVFLISICFSVREWSVYLCTYIGRFRVISIRQPNFSEENRVLHK